MKLMSGIRKTAVSGLIGASLLLSQGAAFPFGDGVVSAKSDIEQTSPALTDTKGHWAEKQINQMVQAGIIKGFPDGTFRPEAPVTEEQFMSLVQRLLPAYNGHELDQFTKETYLAKAKDRWSEEAYANLMVAGIIGYSQPTQGINRLQAGRVLLTALASQSEGEKYRNTREVFFQDVPIADEYQVMTIYPIYKLGVVSGFPDRTFKPDQAVTRAQAVVLLGRLQEKITELYPDDVEDSAKKAMVTAVSQFIDDVMNKQKINSFEKLTQYVKEEKLPVSEGFLQQHFSFMKYDGIDYPSFPHFDELLYFSKIGTEKYRMTVQYYSGELAGSLDKTFYFTSKDGKAFQLIGKE